MKNFNARLSATWLNRWERRLDRPLIYTDAVVGDIEAEKDFVTDFASVRALRIWLNPLYATLVGYGDHSATIHDKLYQTTAFDRKKCDEVFKRALRDEGVARWRVAIFYYGIRTTGWKVYNEYKKKNRV